MAKKRAIISYDKLTLEQKKKLENSFPDGFSSAITEVKTPAGDIVDAIIWETEEIIYLVKLLKPQLRSLLLDEDEDDEDDSDIIEDIDVKVDDEDDEDVEDEDDDDSYDDEDEDDEDDE